MAPTKWFISHACNCPALNDPGLIGRGCAPPCAAAFPGQEIFINLVICSKEG